MSLAPVSTRTVAITRSAPPMTAGQYQAGRPLAMEALSLGCGGCDGGHAATPSVAGAGLAASSLATLRCSIAMPVLRTSS